MAKKSSKKGKGTYLRYASGNHKVKNKERRQKRHERYLKKMAVRRTQGRVKFSTLDIGSEFTWDGDIFTKTADKMNVCYHDGTIRKCFVKSTKVLKK